MVSRESEQLEHTEEQRLLLMDREERWQREHTRSKLSLQRKIEEEWKTREMLLLTWIGEDVKREARIEEQWHRRREESDRKLKNIVQYILSNISKSTKPRQSLSPYDTLLPYTFLEDMIRVLLSRIFSYESTIVPNKETTKDRSRLNFNEIASNMITDIRTKISQHEIRFSKDKEETKFVYSEDDVQLLVDSVLKNISQNSEFQELVEQNTASDNDVLIDRVAGVIKHMSATSAICGWKVITLFIYIFW
ncbi:Fibrous sheath-interacting protein 2 [Manis javanica]|nr:Fibrous sheath-interacting protein 2 [Manis javanica]